MAALFRPEQRLLTATDYRQVFNKPDFKTGQNELLLYQERAGLERDSGNLPTSLQDWPLVFRLNGTQGDLGILFMGEKKSDRLFTYREINILTTLANQIGTTLEKCIRYEGLIKSKREQALIFQKLLQNERLATIGEMTATLAHELKNPLATIRSSAQYVLESGRSFESSKEMLGYIVEEVDILDKNIRSLLGLAKYRPPELKPVRIAVEIRSMVARWRKAKEHHPEIELVCEIPENLPNLECDISQLNQILFNLIHNAEKAIGDKGAINIIAQQEGKFLIVRIVDTGPGIPEDQKESVFDNFHTTKANGAGLGLSVCRQLAEAHGGTITIENSSEGGAEAILSLPFRHKSLLREK